MKNIFKILWIFILLFSGVFAQEVKFIYITDINLSEKNASKLQRTIKEINSFKDVDFVVFGGNNIEKTSYEYFNTFLYLIKKVNKKVYVLLGSNDVLASSGIDKKYYMKRVKRALLFRHSSKPNYVFKNHGQIFIAMDGSKQYFKSPNGFYGAEELKWLEDKLNKYKDKKIIILQHFPLINTNSSWIETAKTEDYLNLLSKYKNVKVIVSGHYKSNLEIKKDGIYHILVEDYNKSNAYKIIEIDLDDDFIGTYLVK